MLSIVHTIYYFLAFVGLDVREMGIPTVDEVISLYCQKMNIPKIENWDFYVAFTFFRFAAILQGVYKRAISGILKYLFSFF